MYLLYSEYSVLGVKPYRLYMLFRSTTHPSARSITVHHSDLRTVHDAGDALPVAGVQRLSQRRWLRLPLALRKGILLLAAAADDDAGHRAGEKHGPDNRPHCPYRHPQHAHKVETRLVRRPGGEDGELWRPRDVNSENGRRRGCACEDRIKVVPNRVLHGRIVGFDGEDEQHGRRQHAQTDSLGRHTRLEREVSNELRPSSGAFRKVVLVTRARDVDLNCPSGGRRRRRRRRRRRQWRRVRAPALWCVRMTALWCVRMTALRRVRLFRLRRVRMGCMAVRRMAVRRMAVRAVSMCAHQASRGAVCTYACPMLLVLAICCEHLASGNLIIYPPVGWVPVDARRR